MNVVTRPGRARRGAACHGRAWQSRLRIACPGYVWLGRARQSRRGLARPGRVRLGWASPGWAGRGSLGMLWFGRAPHGLAGQRPAVFATLGGAQFRSAGPGASMLGIALHGSRGGVSLGSAGLVSAGHCPAAQSGHGISALVPAAFGCARQHKAVTAWPGLPRQRRSTRDHAWHGSHGPIRLLKDRTT